VGRSATFRYPMKLIRRWWTPGLLVVALSVPIVGCGQSAPARSPSVADVPVAPGAQIVSQTRRCDRGARPYCAVQAVVAGGGYDSSGALLKGERAHLDALGWSHSNGDTNLESAADSPGHTLRLQYGTASADLRAIDLGWIQRSPRIAIALSRVMFDRAPAISLMLETGSS